MVICQKVLNFYEKNDETSSNIGNTDWQNKRKVQETLQMLKKNLVKNLIIVGAGGNEGANSMVRKYALEFGITI
jgi:hypothetical protein